MSIPVLESARQMVTVPIPKLEVLIAHERADRLAQVTAAVVGLGYHVIDRTIGLKEVGHATFEARPDVAIVIVAHDSGPQALEAIDVLVKQAACPVIALLDVQDSAFIREAAKRGIPVVATNHVMPENILDHTTLPAWMDALLVKWAWADANRTFQMTSAVTTPTRNAANFLEEAIDITGVVPISCGIAASNYRPDLTPRDRNRVLFVGRFARNLYRLSKLEPQRFHWWERDR